MTLRFSRVSAESGGTQDHNAKGWWELSQLMSEFWWTFRIFLIFFCSGEGKGRGRGGGRLFMENPRRGGVCTRVKWWIWGSKTLKPPEMPFKLGKTSQRHNWPRYMDWPQIGPKSAIKQWKKRQKDKWYPFRALTGRVSAAGGGGGGEGPGGCSRGIWGEGAKYIFFFRGRNAHQGIVCVCACTCS